MEQLQPLQVIILMVGFMLAGAGTFATVGWLVSWRTQWYWFVLAVAAAMLNCGVYVVAVKEIMAI